MDLDHNAIRRAYPQVKTIDDDRGAFDFDGNEVTLDQTLVNAAAAEMATESAWSSLRTKRTKLLAETDWMANSDVTMSDAWRTYRQALRDLPANTSDPANPVWPTEPS
jgi:hypothetical protein